MSFDDMPPLDPLILPGGPEYAERALALSREAVAATRNRLDIPYGTGDFWQKLDVFMPDAVPAQPLPVLLFIHGGAWCKGYKEWMGFMAPPVLRLPAIFVSVNHRLAPAAKYPKPVEDCFAALTWAHRNVAQYGGDPDRIFVGGHSSGGHLASLLALRSDWAQQWGLPANIVKGCFPVSAPLNLHLNIAQGRRREVIRQFLADDGDDYDASPVDHTLGCRTPFLLCYGSDDLPEILAHNREMLAKLRTEDCSAEELVLPGCGHFDTSLGCAVADGPWLTVVSSWMCGLRAPAKMPDQS